MSNRRSSQAYAAAQQQQVAPPQQRRASQLEDNAVQAAIQRSMQDQPPAYAQQYGQQMPLPAGWTEHKTSTGQVYYFNAQRGQTSWARPI